MVIVDVVCGIILIFTTVRAAIRGFVAEAFSLGSIAMGLAVAVIFYPYGAAYLENWLGTGWWNIPITILILFVAGYLTVKLVEAIFQRVLTALPLKGLDRILGMMIGVAEGLIVVYALLVLAQVQTIVDTSSWFSDSLIEELLVPWLRENLPFPQISGVDHLGS